MEETELAYLAGFFDGEGCVSITKHKLRNGSAQYQLKAIIMNTNTELLECFNCHWSGYLAPVKRIPENHRAAQRYPISRRQLYQWSLFGNDAVKFLLDILPYLRVKCEHVKIAVEFQKNIMEHKNHGRLPEEMLKEREELRAKMQDLNVMRKNYKRKEQGVASES